MYNPVSNKTDFPAMEKDILAFWEADDTFKKSLEKTKDKTPFVFYDGPP
ncbi:MAG: class I tRNA ligase family protein, partial [Kiritimatiellae bacterium]|nr:class I tRNA ligase family protein [Kiritimatiellia bacterium]